MSHKSQTHKILMPIGLQLASIWTAISNRGTIFTLSWMDCAWFLTCCSKEAIFCIMHDISSMSVGATPKGMKATHHENNGDLHIRSSCQSDNDTLCSYTGPECLVCYWCWFSVQLPGRNKEQPVCGSPVGENGLTDNQEFPCNHLLEWSTSQV